MDNILKTVVYNGDLIDQAFVSKNDKVDLFSLLQVLFYIRVCKIGNYKISLCFELVL